MNKPFSRINSLLAVLVMVCALFSCSKAPEHVKHIPKDANIVLSVDVKSLGLKSMDFKEILSLNNLKKSFSGNKSAKDSTLEKFKNSGIDLLNTAYLFGSASPEDNNVYGGLVIALSDAEKFAKFLKQENEKAEISSEGDLQIATSKDEEGLVVAWNKNTAIAVFQGKESGVKAKERAVSFFNLKKEETLAENKNFTNLLKQSADISLWMNFEKLGKFAAKEQPYFASVDFKDTYFNATCNFEKGQMLINSKGYYNKSVADKLYFSKAGLSKEVAEAAPAKSLIAALGLGLDMNKIYATLEASKLTGELDAQAQMFGLSGKDMFSMLSGDVLATFNGVTMKDVSKIDFLTGQEVMSREPSPEFSLVIGIADKTKLAALLSSLEKTGMIVKKDNGYSIAGDQMFLVDKGSYVVLTSPSLKQSVIDGNGEKLNGEAAEMYSKDNNGGLYLNMATAATALPEELFSFLGKSYKKDLENSSLESVVFTGSDMKDYVVEGKCVVNFKNKDQNSLITLAKETDNLAAKTQELTGASLKEEEMPVPAAPEDAVDAEAPVAEPAN